MCLCVYPAVCLPALVLVALAHVISQRHKTTHALALRADYEHAALIVSQRPAPARVRRPAHPANLHTVPLRTQGV
ncbi:hypothetical protein H7J08_07900 [Mycobacterium frederiksbergense]|uniref:hypothetical protein n=1 Tax=Mycolicibacterium frederiksbergense TaxID=117567 RepID=UPI0021F39D30|nr:hypothetical protein [Mycolicibacterium frederiksbergense]MCV7044595.1 hypothetical protein [Mycolicibacterium frederiksbergense]